VQLDQPNGQLNAQNFFLLCIHLQFPHLPRTMDMAIVESQAEITEGVSYRLKHLNLD